uniref:Integrase catalytic domain-containing protein n=1 Tax=Fagus sylvatica TaxID=28930 RepID=A0A2N9F4R5_FAGSY
MCVDYRDLNQASPKDNFPLPHINTLANNIATNVGTFVYDVMPFGLKNAEATYQRAMVTLFHDVIHQEIEVYVDVDDMIAKSRTPENHLGRSVRNLVLLKGNQRAILFVTRKAIKGQAIADYLANYPFEQQELTDVDAEFPDKDVMEMDEDSLCLQTALEFGAHELDVFGDSLLAHNHFADARSLPWQASSGYKRGWDDVQPPLRIVTREVPSYCVCIEECMSVEAELVMTSALAEVDYDIKRFVQQREYPIEATKNEKKYIRRMAFQFFLREEVLYKRTHDAMLLHWVDAEEANQLIDEMHEGLMEAHANGPFLVKKIMRASSNSVCEEQYHLSFKIKHLNSTPYRPKMNGVVQAANKNVKRILSKMTETYKDWHKQLSYALCAYRTSVKTSTGATPNSLVYGMEAVLPMEVEIPSLRILSQTKLDEAEWAQARYEQLNFIDEKRMTALCHGQLYQRRFERAYNKKMHLRMFKLGDLVLKKRNMAIFDPRGKFAPDFEGPYVVKKAFSGGALILADMDDEEFHDPTNSDSVIKYYV